MSQYGEPDHYILHVSDTHFVTDGALLHDCVDSDANLSRLFERLEKAGRRPEAIVFTGDLADRGEPEAYVRLRRIVEPAAERLGARVIWVMGNHDARPAFRSSLLDAEPTQDSVDAVVDVNGLRIIVLDSTVPGFHHGLISDEQLTWLTDVLAEPAPHGTLLALHHPPVPGLLDALESVELMEQHRLETVLAGTDVRGILAGHLHYSTATCYTQDLLVDEGSIRGQDGAQGFNMVHVYRDRVLHTVVPLDGSPAVYEMTAEETRQSLEQLTAPGV
jgi:3',5'-cyclic AMP phosphodiesterase CpdA